MSLKAATWSPDWSPPPTKPRPSHTGYNKMALANILGSQQRRDGQPMAHRTVDTKPTGTRIHETYAVEEFDRRNDSGYSDSPSTSAGSSRYQSGSAYSPPPFMHTQSHTSNYSRTSRSSFGTCQNGRYYCSYVCPITRARCVSWPDGYTTSYDLDRHADAEHGPGMLSTNVGLFLLIPWTVTR
jgi:hypothetical protein